MATIVKLPSSGWINLDTIAGASVVKGRLLLGRPDGSESLARTLEDDAAIIAALDAEDAKRRAAADPSPTFSAPAPDMSHDLRIDAPWRSAPPEEGPKVTCRICQRWESLAHAQSHDWGYTAEHGWVCYLCRTNRRQAAARPRKARLARATGQAAETPQGTSPDCGGPVRNVWDEGGNLDVGGEGA